MILLLLVPILILTYIKKLLTNREKKCIKGRHVVVTGGSSGIGKCVAVIAARKGAHVTIIARNPERLREAEAEIKAARVNENQLITALSVDVTNSKSIERALEKIEITVAPVYMLVNCAGKAICGELEKFTDEQVNDLISVNFLGTLYPTRAVIPKFKQRKEGIVVLTGSQASLMGMFGYSIYSSCKFALRGLAESISMELRPYDVSVTLSLPPDTDTPGFESENKTKPKATKLISESGGLFQPHVVAEKLINDALNGEFFSYVGFESFLLTTLCVGMSPFSNFCDVILQTIILGPIRLFSAFYVNSFYAIVNKCHSESENPE